MSDWNANIIEEFRANDGRVGGVFEGKPLLILEHVGARTGTVRHAPLMYQDLGGGAVAVFASKNGADTNPDWYHNVSGHPEVRAEIGVEAVDLVAREAHGAERDQIWSRQKAEFPQFADYEARADRQIPVIVLEPRPSAG